MAIPSNLLIAWSLLLGTGFFIVFGALSDKIGRKPIILAGCLIAALTFFPIFRMITTNANPALEKAIETAKVEVVADPKGCGDLFNPVGTRVFTAPCDTARAFLAQSSVKYSTVPGPAGSGVKVMVNGKEVPYTDAKTSNPLVAAAVGEAGYPKAGNPSIVKMAHPFDIFRPQVAAVIGLLFILVLFVTMVYGPIAAMLVELFPTRIRYTSMSLPYHIGNGWFGGLLAGDRLRHRGINRRYLRGPLVPGDLCAHHGGDRLLLPAGNQGRRHHQVKNKAQSPMPIGRGSFRGRFLLSALSDFFSTAFSAAERPCRAVDPRRDQSAPAAFHAQRTRVFRLSCRKAPAPTCCRDLCDLPSQAVHRFCR